MPAPTSLAAIGAVRPGATYPALALTRDHDRFADVRAIRLGRMPKVRVGQVWADCDPRNAGRTVRVVGLRTDGKAVVINETPAAAAPLTKGAASLIAVRRFRPTSRGFSLVAEAPAPKKRRKRAAKSPVTTVRPIAADGGCSSAATGSQAETIDTIASMLVPTGHPVLPVDYRAAAGLHGLLGTSGSSAFLGIAGPDGRTPPAAYAEDGIVALFTRATEYIENSGLLREWSRSQS